MHEVLSPRANALLTKLIEINDEVVNTTKRDVQAMLDLTRNEYHAYRQAEKSHPGVEGNDLAKVYWLVALLFAES